MGSIICLYKLNNWIRWQFQQVVSLYKYGHCQSKIIIFEDW